MEDELQSDNQTRFGAEEPLFETRWQPEPVVSETTQTSKPSRKKWWLIGGGVAMLVLVLVLVLITAARRSPTVAPGTEATPSPMSQTLSPLDAKINALRTELKAADPSEQDLPFPPVQMTILIDELPR